VTAPQPVRAVEPGDCRCVCGSLVARVVPDGVELKCRRCKRTLVVAWEDGPPTRCGTPVQARPMREAGRGEA
jgi:phage FluMu protein Com